MIDKLRMWWYEWYSKYCYKRAKEDEDDFHYAGYDRWMERYETAEANRLKVYSGMKHLID